MSEEELNELKIEDVRDKFKYIKIHLLEPCQWDEVTNRIRDLIIHIRWVEEKEMHPHDRITSEVRTAVAMIRRGLKAIMELNEEVAAFMWSHWPDPESGFFREGISPSESEKKGAVKRKPKKVDSFIGDKSKHNKARNWINENQKYLKSAKERLKRNPPKREGDGYWVPLAAHKALIADCDDLLQHEQLRDYKQKIGQLIVETVDVIRTDCTEIFLSHARRVREENLFLRLVQDIGEMCFPGKDLTETARTWIITYEKNNS